MWLTDILPRQTVRHSTSPRPRRGGVGPNAVTRLAEALLPLGTATRAQVFEGAGLSHYLERPPNSLVPETEVTRLHAALRSQLGSSAAARVSEAAGCLTADYLLAYRIPVLAQRILRRLPPRLAAHLLVRAIARHAWTFAGNGRFAFTFGRGVTLSVYDSPLCRNVRSDAPTCSFFVAVFARIFGAMLGDSVLVRETACLATGCPVCRFEVTWGQYKGSVN